MIELDASNTLIGNIINQYNVYNKQYCSLYKNPQESTDIVINNTGIPCYWWDLDIEINDNTSNIICIDALTEGANLQERFTTYDKNKEYIIFSNGWWDVNKYDFGFKYKLCVYNYIWYNFIVLMTYPQYINYYVNKTYQITKNKSNLFCALIGANKPARDYLVDEIKLRIIPDNYILNYCGKEMGQPSRQYDLNYNFKEFRPATPIEEVLEQYTISYSIPTELFNSARFNLVVETNIDLISEFHFTEKTLKPLIIGMPFIVMSSPYYLENMHKLGFRTFNELWNEDYDKIEDFKDRVTALIGLINNLTNFDWNKHKEKLQEIVNHNKINVIYNSGNNIINQFNNIGTALSNL
jgi:hypothetical protein